jgi:cation:H+ antiporter
MVQWDLPIMVATTLALLPIFWTGGVISRKEGVLLVGLYGLYLVEQVLPLYFPALASPLRSITLWVIVPLLVLLLGFQVWQYSRRPSVQAETGN